MAQILVFGDSITYGAWDEEGGWVARLRRFIDAKIISDPKFPNPDFYCDVYNLGIDGGTTEDLLKRFEFETKQRAEDGEETIFLFEIGGNDSAFVHSKNGNMTEPKRFKENLHNLIKLARKYSFKIIFMGLGPIDETKTMPVPWNKEIYYKEEYNKKYCDAIKAICKEEKVHFISIFKFMEKNRKKFLEDGLHPNSEGHKLIFEIVKDFMIENKMI